MTVGEFCNREVIVAFPTSGVTHAAKLMRRHHVGDLVVVDQAGPHVKPLGIVTDRDIVIEIIAKDVQPEKICITDIMSTDPVRAKESDSLWDTLRRMQTKGIRRILVVNDQGELAGILTMDDVIGLLAEEITALTKLVKREQNHEQDTRP